MNTTPITLNLNITGQLTIDPKNLEQLISGLQIQSPNQLSVPASPTDPKSLPRLFLQLQLGSRQCRERCSQFNALRHSIQKNRHVLEEFNIFLDFVVCRLQFINGLGNNFMIVCQIFSGSPPEYITSCITQSDQMRFLVGFTFCINGIEVVINQMIYFFYFRQVLICVIAHIIFLSSLRL